MAGDGERRRQRLVAALASARGPVPGKRLAQALGVSRQVIVQDVALLRSSGTNVASTNRGYVLVEAQGHSRTFKVRHTADQIEDELNLFVDLGGTVEDVVVNHRTYGRLKARLGIASRRDVRRYLDDIRSSKSTPLSTITSGYHFHHVSAPSEDVLDDIEDALRERGFLVERLPYELGQDLD